MHILSTAIIGNYSVKTRIITKKGQISPFDVFITRIFFLINIRLNHLF